MVGRIGGVRAVRGHRLLHRRVYLFPAVHADREERTGLLARVPHGALAEALELVPGEQHEVRVLAHQHSGRGRIRELGVEAEPQLLEKPDRALEITDGDVDEQLVRRGRAGAGVPDRGWGSLR